MSYVKKVEDGIANILANISMTVKGKIEKMLHIPTGNRGVSSYKIIAG